jgi:ATP-dependent Clp protease ATP-binding subunit ClpA
MAEKDKDDNKGKKPKTPQNRAFEGDDEDSGTEIPKKDKKKGASATPVLDNYGKDLTKLAAEGKLDPVVGRVKEVDRIAQILCRRKKNNPVIIGEAGCIHEDTIITVRKVSDVSEHEIVIVQ